MTDPAGRSTEGMPRWVKVFGIAAVLIVLLFVVLLIAGGPHDPGRHMSAHGGHIALAGA